MADVWWTCPDCGTITSVHPERHNCLSNLHPESLRNRFGVGVTQEPAAARVSAFSNPPSPPRRPPPRQDAPPPRQAAIPKKPRSPKKKQGYPAWPTAPAAPQPPPRSPYGDDVTGPPTPHDHAVFASVQKLLIKKIEKGILGDLAEIALEALRNRDD